MWCEFWRHLPQLSLKVALFKLVVISLPWLSEVAVEFLHKKTELSEQSGDDGSETNLKFLKQQRALGVERTGPCPVMRGRVSVSVWGLCPLSSPVLNGGQNRCWLYFHWTNTHAGPPNSFMSFSIYIYRVLSPTWHHYIENLLLIHTVSLIQTYLR